MMIVALANQAMPPPPSGCDPFVVMFGLRSSALDKNGRAILSNLIAADRAGAHRSLRIVGHSDVAEGSASEKLKLSQDRAAVAKRYASQLGISDPAIETEGVSDRLPLRKGSYPENRFVAVDTCKG